MHNVRIVFALFNADFSSLEALLLFELFDELSLVSTLPRFAVHAEMPIMIITNKIKQPQPDPQPQNQPLLIFSIFVDFDALGILSTAHH